MVRICSNGSYIYVSLGRLGLYLISDATNSFFAQPPPPPSSGTWVASPLSSKTFPSRGQRLRLSRSTIRLWIVWNFKHQACLGPQQLVLGWLAPLQHHVITRLPKCPDLQGLGMALVALNGPNEPMLSHPRPLMFPWLHTTLVVGHGTSEGAYMGIPGLLPWLPKWPNVPINCESLDMQQKK